MQIGGERTIGAVAANRAGQRIDRDDVAGALPDRAEMRIAQVPALLVTLPAIGYIWWSGSYGNGEATVFTVLLFVAGMADNVLKPLMLGRGVKAPMVVILLGALGGMATAGILGLFVGATLLTLGYKIFMSWVEDHPNGIGAESRTPSPG